MDLDQIIIEMVRIIIFKEEIIDFQMEMTEKIYKIKMQTGEIIETNKIKTKITITDLIVKMVEIIIAITIINLVEHAH